ncbi:toxin secretion/phage lysis holin [Anaerosolibacter carboniphilus]|uniref:Toxin secretion/phage lysis holin n=1 Tax=Anaerosolibacter carboniphilus TaxID=1417629 RepID=A0A841L8Q8_9FIRM|nr:phage holin family protein [Anaerosolibacter carboniphilus]MBB6218645.1 toxin secretion/phage lysis holin [Anaerosolibacter carboniphilus]
MEQIANTKLSIMTTIGVIGSVFASMLGGWDTALQTLVIFMTIDYITGLVVAGVFQQSNKSEGGGLESKAGWKGLCRKGMTLLIILVAYQLDKTIGSDFIRTAVIIAYISNEAVSIIENAGVMGLPIPEAIRKGIDILKNKNEEKDGSI